MLSEAIIVFVLQRCTNTIIHMYIFCLKLNVKKSEKYNETLYSHSSPKIIDNFNVKRCVRIEQMCKMCIKYQTVIALINIMNYCNVSVQLKCNLKLNILDYTLIFFVKSV